MFINDRLTHRLAPLILLFLCWALSPQLWASPTIETWESAKGTKVLFVAAPDLPMLDLRIAFQAGSARDAGHPGLASLTAALLDQGAGAWDADSIAERLEAVGAELGIEAQRDMVAISLRTLTREPALGQSIETLEQIISQPRFATADFNRVRDNAIIALKRDDQDPATLGQKAFFRLVFGEHPYASDPAGTPTSLTQLTPEDLTRFHDRYYVARNAIIAMVGAISRQEAEAIADKVTVGLPPGESAPPVQPVTDSPGSSLKRIDFPSTQTHVYTGQAGMSRTDQDYFPLYVGNHILGGSGLVSLLMEEVREKRGLSYSVYSYFLPLAERGPFLAGLATKNDQGQQAQDVLMATIQRFRDQGPSQEELDAAVKNITGGFPLRIAGNRKIAQYLSIIGFYGLPLDYLDRFNERISAVTAEAIRDAFQRRIDPSRFATVIVGPGTSALARSIP